MIKDKEINDKIRKLKIGLKHTMKKWNKQKKILKSRYLSNFENNIDTLEVRNLTFTNNVIQKINNNLVEIDSLSRNNDNKNIIDDKFTTSMMLLQSVCRVGNKYSYKTYDYEIMSIKAINSKLDNIGKTNRGDKNFEKNKKNILEAFDSVKVKITEGFDFSPVTDLIDKIGDGFKFVIDGIIKIAKFVGEALKDFVILMFTLLKMLWEFIVKFIPKVIELYMKVWEHLLKWLPKYGVFMVISYIVAKENLTTLVGCYLVPTLILLTGSEDMLSNVITSTHPNGLFGPQKSVEAQLMGFLYEGKCHPIITQMISGVCSNIIFFYFMYTFWFNPEHFEYAQKLFFEIIFWMISGPMKGLVAWILGIDKDDELFSEIKGANDFAEKIGRFSLLFFKDMFMVVLRTIGLSIVTVLLYKLLYKPNLSTYVPTIRELSFLPLLALKDIINISGIGKLLPPYE